MNLSLEAFKRLPVWQASLIGPRGIRPGLAGYRFLVAISHIYAAGLFGLGGLDGRRHRHVMAGDWLAVCFGVIGFAPGLAHLWINTTATGPGFSPAPRSGSSRGRLRVGARACGPARSSRGGGGRMMFSRRHVPLLATSVLVARAVGIGTMVRLNFAGAVPVEQDARGYLALFFAAIFAGISAQFRGSQEIANRFRRVQEAQKQGGDCA